MTGLDDGFHGIGSLPGDLIHILYTSLLEPQVQRLHKLKAMTPTWTEPESRACWEFLGMWPPQLVSIMASWKGTASVRET